MRISDWSSDVCSSDLLGRRSGQEGPRGDPRTDRLRPCRARNPGDADDVRRLSPDKAGDARPDPPPRPHHQLKRVVRRDPAPLDGRSPHAAYLDRIWLLSLFWRALVQPDLRPARKRVVKGTGVSVVVELGG